MDLSRTLGELIPQATCQIYSARKFGPMSPVWCEIAGTCYIDTAVTMLIICEHSTHISWTKHCKILLQSLTAIHAWKNKYPRGCISHCHAEVQACQKPANHPGWYFSPRWFFSLLSPHNSNNKVQQGEAWNEWDVFISWGRYPPEESLLLQVYMSFFSILEKHYIQLQRMGAIHGKLGAFT